MMRRLTPVVALILLMPGFVRSDEWSVKGSVDQSLAYDDNVLMASDASCDPQVRNSCPRDSFKYMIIPVLAFQHRTDASDVSAHASYGTQLYTDIPELDQNFQTYGVNGAYNTEKIDWGLNWNYSITPTRNTASVDNGIFGNNSDRNSWSVSPSATYKIDEIDSISLTPSYTETTFDKSSTNPSDPSNNFFNDSRNYEINLAWQRLWSERYLSGVSFFYSKFDSQVQVQGGQGIILASPSSFDNFGINFSNTYMIADNWKLSAVVGGRYTESDIGGVTSTSFGFLADASVNYTGENYTAGLHFMRGLIPSSFGQLQEQTSVGLNFNYKILEKLSSNLNFNYQESTLVNDGSGATIVSSIGNRTSFVIEPSVSWQFARDWSLGGSYRYRFQDNQGGGAGAFAGEADSNLFMISINYNWQGINVSK
jgi:hypothetical protein